MITTPTPKTAPRPRRCKPSELTKVGVVLIEVKHTLLGCMKCGRQWSPMLRRDGRLPRGYWRCPEGCNSTT